ncbi:MAG: alpha/beta fold hydrolase [Pyrinomonadaceae bacterium]
MRISIWRKLLGSLLKLMLPAILLIILATVAGTVWLIHLTTEEPPRVAYLITPARFKEITNSGRQFTEETWDNKDKTSSRGWLMRGTPGAPAVILLHRYGADRSWLLNLGIKLNGATNFTVLIPDLRGHGEKPTVKYTSLGGCEADDLIGSLGFLRAQKSEKGENLVGPKVGIYGVEIGAIAAMMGAANSSDVQALALDSVPASTGDVLQTLVSSRTAFAAAAIGPLAITAAPLYFMRGCYKDTPLCETAAALSNRKILLLAGKDAPHWQESTIALASCFGGGANVEKKTDLQPSGYNLIQSATPEQQEAYNKMVIDFFRQALAGG